MNTRLTPPENHDKSLALELKPFRHIEALIKHVLPATERVVIGRGDVVHYYKDDIRQCFLLLQGSVALHRRGDGIVLNSESAPFILGVSSQFSSEHLYVRALETSEIARVPLDCFNHIVAQLDLWEHFSKLLIYTASRVYEHCAQISQMSAYDIIRFQLVELMQEPDAIRQKITAAAYIKSRTYLSRSGIMRILAELRTGKYITMERGILLDINHLPRKY
ncbi:MULTISPECIES: winged helix-turn-helix transcriptional regulator [Klebsiella pneumoniae complex]|uniref:winged helix-turn-helix transcriptional regulator n=1 Tax=Klebsiella pneumoniae complex TaxID=3390273 RepID=UPI000B4123A1|nr:MULTISPECIES: winged helix-turn-helix transcriptional regulator [Klebsiella]HBY0607122.1 Crp/Fnr family transcriptional regulator [Klebsiella pneumoniae subsp. pneumoniae]HCB0992007.1 helix-turn-helix domain-containing protein [Klebsiella variicola subsp. variicola]MBD7161051.1 helix-turn-helix domain-containing protein [Klebsiella pneumoniae]MBD7727586.1 helix-turn-helix domain-containing protein [Klebsiella pneumoniae]MBK3174938.1 cyclic nucleotide-binding protein [Klebsiella pneumoniae]